SCGRSCGCGRSSTPTANGCGHERRLEGAQQGAEAPALPAPGAGVSELAFLSPGEAQVEAGFAPRAVSPLARALDGARGIRDLSLLGKLEVRGPSVGWLDSDLDVLRITPARALIVCAPEECAELRRSLPGLVVDLTGALAVIALESADLMRRLTDLDLSALSSAV